MKFIGCEGNALLIGHPDHGFAMSGLVQRAKEEVSNGGSLFGEVKAQEIILQFRDGSKDYST